MRRSGSRTARALAVALGGGLLAACLIDLPGLCGDGSIDPGEDCDPGVDGTDLTRCDPSCKLTAAPTCGDGRLDAGEQCDANDFGNKDCPSGKGFLSCTADCKLDDSTCDRCGDGHVDLDSNEECDPKAPFEPVACSELANYPIKPYTSGQMRVCTDKCRFYRGLCGYCGDDKVDPPRPVDANDATLLSVREVCDGKSAQLGDLRDYCRARCPGEEPLCAFQCDSGCERFGEPLDDPQCCAQSGTPCPNPGDPLPCCAAYDAGLEDLFSQEACSTQYQTTGFLTLVCK